MALLFMDGFDQYAAAADLDRRWSDRSGALYDSSGGRFAGSGVAYFNTNSGNHLRKVLAAGVSTVIVGFAYRTSGNNAQYPSLLSLREGGTDHLILDHNKNTYNLAVYRGATLLATASSPMALSAWHHIEIKATIHDTNGAVEVRLNGVTVINVTNVDTRNGGASGLINGVVLGVVGGWVAVGNYDDVYILDTSGSTNNDFLGDCRIHTLVPSGAGSSTQLTPSAGANWQCVDETAMNADTDFVSSATAGHVDLYAMGDLPTTPAAVRAVVVSAVVRKTDAGDRSMKAKLKSGATTATSSTKTLSTTYQIDDTIHEVDPNTLGAWNKAAVDAIEAGVEVV
jgi:hypothetical protein